MLLKAAMPFNFSSPEFLSHHRRRKNRDSPVSRASPAHMNSTLDPVCTVPDPQGHDNKLNTFKMSVALEFLTVLQNLTTNQRKSGEGIYVRKLTKLDVVIARIRYRVNGVLNIGCKKVLIGQATMCNIIFKRNLNEQLNHENSFDFNGLQVCFRASCFCIPNLTIWLHGGTLPSSVNESWPTSATY